MNYRITPAEFLNELGWKFQKRGLWLTLKICPVCGGGNSKDVFTFAVHAIDGNFFCHRAKCGAKGSFWKLIEENERNPREYLDKGRKTKSKRFIYGR